MSWISDLLKKISNFCCVNCKKHGRAPKDCENDKPSDELTGIAKFKDDFKFILIFVVCFGFFRFFILDYYMVPSSSMFPTLLIGDMPLVKKWEYGYSKHSMWFSPDLFSGRIFFKDNVKRGDVIVFKAPEDLSINVIKRVIALPGDKISVQDGIISVNGEKSELVFKKKTVYHDINTESYHQLNLFEEKLPISNAPIHLVAYDEQMRFSMPNHFEETTVPEGHYFVMGDNRDYSKDSRCGLGLIPAENLMGRAKLKIYSIGGGVKIWQPWLWLQNIRYDRILNAIE